MSQVRSHLKPQTSAAFLLVWTVLVVVESPTHVQAHVPSRSLYYGSLGAQREHITRSPLLPYSLRTRNHKSETSGNHFNSMPTCPQLRTLWKASVNQVSETLNKGYPNHIPKLAPGLGNNPYYLTLLLWRQEELLREKGLEPDFGKIVTTEPGVAPTKAHSEENWRQSYPQHAPSASIATIPGQFGDYPAPETELGADYVYGHVVRGPQEAGLGSAGTAGGFGRFDPREEEPTGSDQIREASGESSMRTTVRPEPSKHSSRSNSNANANANANAKGSSSSSSNSNSNNNGGSTLTASEFFNSIWHENPVKI